MSDYENFAVLCWKKRICEREEGGVLAITIAPHYEFGCFVWAMSGSSGSVSRGLGGVNGCEKVMMELDVVNIIN